MQVPSLPPPTSAPPGPAGTLTLQTTLSPNPAVAEGNVTVAGQAVWSTGTSPQGTVQILVCALTCTMHVLAMRSVIVLEFVLGGSGAHGRASLCTDVYQCWAFQLL
jgi:hypothetical protein